MVIFRGACEKKIWCTNEEEECGGNYITGLCRGGDASFDSGKFHNHCNFCEVRFPLIEI